MPSIIEDARIKAKCQVFTPVDIVDYMLDLAGYDVDIYGKTILENSCGNGEILERIVNRYVKDCLRQSISVEQIRSGLERDVVAYDVDPEMVTTAKQRLDTVVSKYGIAKVKWNISNADFLEEKCIQKFKYIIGNPPYIAYADLPDATRSTLRETFSCCKKGKFDYSYAFIEQSYNALQKNGQLVYLVPCYILKNVYAQCVRELIKNDICTVVEFQNGRVFKQALVTPAIIHVAKESNSQSLRYKVYGTSLDKGINKVNLGTKWTFGQEVIAETRLGDLYNVSSCIATLYNDAFVVKGGIMDGDNYILGAHKIEKAILRQATSPKTQKNRKENEYIIFPYFFDDQDKLQHYSEREMYQKFPHCIKYLESFKSKLDERCADDTAAWYEYGRSQAIQNMNQPKILISSIISERTKAYLLDTECIPYSGIYIIPRKDSSLEELVEHLNSRSFKTYVENIGVSVSGKSKRITTRDIEDFMY